MSIAIDQMRQISLSTFLLVLLLTSCQTTKDGSSKQEYLRWVGDIEHSDQIDEPGFEICNGDDNVLQYFNLGEGPVYEGEKSQILDVFKSKYIPVKGNDENGWIRIRFIVNCNGKAGRFRVLQSDYNYQEKEFNTKVINQLLEITREIDQWQILERAGIPVDYYMYLIFKINDGQLIEILP